MAAQLESLEVPPEVAAGILDAADGLAGAAVQLTRDRHPDQLDILISRARGFVSGLEGIQRKRRCADTETKRGGGDGT